MPIERADTDAFLGSSGEVSCRMNDLRGAVIAEFILKTAMRSAKLESHSFILKCRHTQCYSANLFDFPLIFLAFALVL
jgi:hypothetical protein